MWYCHQDWAGAIFYANRPHLLGFTDVCALGPLSCWARVSNAFTNPRNISGWMTSRAWQIMAITVLRNEQHIHAMKKLGYSIIKNMYFNHNPVIDFFMILIISYTVCKKVQITCTHNTGEKYIFIPKKSLI